MGDKVKVLIRATERVVYARTVEMTQVQFDTLNARLDDHDRIERRNAEEDVLSGSTVPIQSTGLTWKSSSSSGRTPHERIAAVGRRQPDAGGQSRCAHL